MDDAISKSGEGLRTAAEGGAGLHFAVFACILLARCFAMSA